MTFSWHGFDSIVALYYFFPCTSPWTENVDAFVFPVYSSSFFFRASDLLKVVDGTECLFVLGRADKDRGSLVDVIGDLDDNLEREDVVTFPVSVIDSFSVAL